MHFAISASWGPTDPGRPSWTQPGYGRIPCVRSTSESWSTTGTPWNPVDTALLAFTVSRGGRIVNACVFFFPLFTDWRLGNG
jgi:hypothetical protein